MRCKLIAEVSVVQQSANVKLELPTINNSVKDVVQKFAAKRNVTERHILSRVSAVFESGTIMLLLGQPGSGKSSLLKLLSGQFPMEKNIGVEGDITYNGAVSDLSVRLPRRYLWASCSKVPCSCS